LGFWPSRRAPRKLQASSEQARSKKKMIVDDGSDETNETNETNET